MLKLLYDFQNRRTQAGFGATSTTSPVYQNSIAYTWDGANRLTQVVDSVSGTITRSYDDRFDTVTQETTPQGMVNYTYQADGRKYTMSPSGGTTLIYTYDNARRPYTAIQLAGTGPGQPGTAQAAVYGYDEADRRTSLTLPNGLIVNYDYDDSNELTSLTYLQSDGVTQIGNLTYNYDAAGRRINMGGSLADSNLPQSMTADYNANNQLKTFNGGGIRNYDANGNFVFDGTLLYTWNARNQLASYCNYNCSTSGSFSYDAFGRRIAKTINGTTTKYLYDGNNPIQEQDGTGAVTANLLVGLGTDEYHARTEVGGATKSYLPDALGSTWALSNSVGAVTTVYTYEPYGKTTATGFGSANAFQYTGRENDGGLYYYRARYYDSGVGRFISEDPIGLAGGLNVYAYVKGDPISQIDPLGLANGPWAHPNFTPHVPQTLGDLLSEPNGNMWGEPGPQDNVCSLGRFVGPMADACVLDRCQRHDLCYADNGCTQSSWMSSVLGGTKSCNRCNSGFFKDHGASGSW